MKKSKLLLFALFPLLTGCDSGSYVQCKSLSNGLMYVEEEKQVITYAARYKVNKNQDGYGDLPLNTYGDDKDTIYCVYTESGKNIVIPSLLTFSYANYYYEEVEYSYILDKIFSVKFKSESTVFLNAKEKKAYVEEYNFYPNSEDSTTETVIEELTGKKVYNISFTDELNNCTYSEFESTHDIQYVELGDSPFTYVLKETK